MNGFATLFFCAIVAQSNIAPLGSAPGSGLSLTQDPSKYTQFGWQLNEVGELEYLIQISPDMLPFMTRATGQQEFQCEIPRELAGRIHRVVVSIGTTVLPRSPSLQEIQQRIPVIASLPGRLRELESGSPVVNVQNTLPDFPAPLDNRNNPRNGLDSPPAPTTPLGSSFLDQARSNNPQQPAPSRNQLDPNLPSPPSMAQQGGGFGNQAGGNSYANSGANNGRFNDTANLPNGNPPGYNQPGFNQPNTNQTQLNQSYDAGNYPNVAQQPRSNNQSSGFDSQFAYDPSGTHRNDTNRNDYARGSNPPYQGPEYARQNTQFPSTSGGYGDLHGQQGMSITDRARGNDRWDGNSFANNPQMGRPGNETFITANQRDNRPLFDNPSSASDGRTNMASTTGTDGSNVRTDNNRTGQAAGGTAAASNESNYHLFVFFVLSVAVNLWMMHLLRSLYVRYRNLLASLRGHTVVTTT